MAINHGGSKRLHQLAMLSLLVLFIVFRFGLDSVQAARVSDIRGTKHNLSAAADGSAYTHPTAGGGTVPTRNIKASSETQLCVFCHTPHGASTTAKPLWNRKAAGDALYSQSYVLYDSNTLDAKQVQGSLSQPGGSSKLCLSCHDGTVAVGNVNVLNGLDKSGQAKTTSVIATTGGTTMPTGSGATTGFTRNLGTDLTNDHPISISFNDALADRDGELRKPSLNSTLIGVRTTSSKPKLKLEQTGDAGDNLAQVQCATCHDPHIRETDPSVGNQKFLRLNRFQHQNPPSSTGFNSADNSGDIICLACHDKAGASWAFSAHANPLVADETYNAATTTQREFPANLPVWQAACLNCHDTHTVPGARRLLREGTDSAATPKSGGNPALEQTCYQCHTTAAQSVITGGSGGAPDIKSDFALARKMPLGVGAPEVHDPSSAVNISGFLDCSQSGTQCGKDLLEGRDKLGVGNLANRHAECTDCHNPHRVIRARNGLPGALTGTNTSTAMQNGASGGAHDHRNATGYTHTNIISGVLRGSWGVEPSYGSASFHALPTGYTIKRGDPGSSSATDVAQPYVTREYQICLKCHSDYGYSDNNQHVANGGNRPLVGAAGTPSGTNGLTMYTNQAKEFQPAAGHEGGSTGKNLGNAAGSADANYTNNNHRSWHPVMGPTGRTAALRNVSATSAWRTPWSNSLGTQTMYCTDCHGSNVTSATSVIPDTGKPWGPHGSTNNYILKGTWDQESTSSSTPLCLKCHSPTSSSGFNNSDRGNLHSYHVDKIGRIECTWCHVAVPHGWKNRSLLVNLNDVGEEAGFAAGSSFEVSTSSGSDNYTKEPYYLEAKLKIRSFQTSGSWAETSCGSAAKAAGSRIAASNGNTSNTTGSGKDYMRNTCGSPP